MTALREAAEAYVAWQYRQPGARRFTLTDLRAALAVRPAPSAQIPDEDLPGYRQPFTGPLGSRGDPTVALAGPSADADAAWLEWARQLVHVHRDGIRLAFREPLAERIAHEAAIRATAPSEGAWDEASLSYVGGPSDGTGGLDGPEFCGCCGTRLIVATDPTP